MCIIAWILVTLMLLVLNVPYAFTLGLVAGLTRAIPIVGPILGGIPLLLVCQFYTGSTQTTLALLSGFTLMHFLESKVLLPKIVGHHVDLHPVSVILSLLIGMEFFGFIGVFLAVPIAAVMKILLAEFHDVQEQKLQASGDGRAVAVLRSNGQNPGGNGAARVAVVDETPLQ
jgi:predicted PurR-regulated permease PerM